MPQSGDELLRGAGSGFQNTSPLSLYLGWTSRMPTSPGDPTFAAPEGVRLAGSIHVHAPGRDARQDEVRSGVHVARSAPRSCMRRRCCARWSAPTKSGWSSLAAFVGCGTGIVVWLMNADDPTRPPDSVRHRTAPNGSARWPRSIPMRTVLVPALGGLALGLGRRSASPAYDRAARSTRSRPTRCSAAACR